MDLRVVLEAKFEFEVLFFFEEGEEVEEEKVEAVLEEGERGCSFARRRSVSAATMPPIECPIRMVWTDGSMVGEGVECATSMSITRF